MKELMDLSHQLLEEKAKNPNSNNYEGGITGWVNKWAWWINNCFSGTNMAKYGIIAGVAGTFLYKIGALGTLVSWTGWLIEKGGLVLQGKVELLKYLSKAATSTKNTVLGWWSNILDWFDNTKVKTMDEYNKRTYERIGVGSLMLTRLFSIMGYGKGFLSLVANNLDHFIFQKEPEKLVELCDQISNLKGFDLESCTNDVVNAYDILHSEFPDTYNDLVNPSTFNKMVSTLKNKMFFTDEDSPYQDIRDIPDLQKYLIDYKNNPPTSIPDFPMPKTPMIVDDNQSLMKNFFSFFGWISMLIQMLTGFWKLGNTVKQLYDNRTKNTITTDPDTLPLTNSNLPANTSNNEQSENENTEDTEGSSGNEGGPIIEMVDEQEDIEKGIRKRK